MNSVEGRSVLVTIANRGIGKAIVEGFLDAGAGRVYAAARRTDALQPLVDAYGERIVPLEIDLNRPQTIAAAAAVASDVEIVVNNAGMLNIEGPISSNAVAALQTEMEVNVYDLMRVAQAFAPILAANGGGVLVKLNSVASLKSFSSFVTYSASKAAAYSIPRRCATSFRGRAPG